MTIADSVLKHHLKHIYWINGGPCGGKTTTTRRLAEKHGFAVFDCKEYIQQYQRGASFQDHPALLRPFVDWDWFFNRPVDVYARWLSDFNNEVAQWAVVDLMKLPVDRPVVVEQEFVDPELLARISSPQRVALLFAEDNLIERELLNRPEHEPMRSMIHRTKDPVASERNVLTVATELSHRMQAEAEKSGLFVHTRSVRNQNEDLLPLIERHFNL